ncbi:MAG: proton-conducting transporter membrane subunit [Spirochaetia bacterium]|jgi:hydrogenase-4 component F
MILILVLLPACAAVVAWLIRADSPRRVLLVAVSAIHAGLVCWLWIDPARFPPVGAWLAVDGLGLVFLGITSILFLAVSLSVVEFLRRESGTTRADPEEGFLFDNTPEALFTACLLGFLSTMTLVTTSQHFGLLWVAIEGTTLASAPLIHYHRHHRSLEATWKYLLVCSVGIAFALLGTYFLAAAVPAGGVASMTFTSLVENASRLDPRWLKAGFLLLLVGYGTKMGLAPMHTWLPDAHSEAPSVVSALLSGALLNMAFLAILRILSVIGAAGLGQLGRQTILVFGLVSMGVAAGLIIGQPDYKRMLAYSSVEHVGILAVGIGLGGLGNWAALFHAVNHSLIKASLFLLAGNLLTVFGSKRISDVRGALRTTPVTGVLWVAGFFAIMGAPPFGAFTSELAILRAAVETRAWVVVVAFSLLLAAVFAGMIGVLVRTAQGAPVTARVHEPALSLIAPASLLAVSVALGVFIPGFLDRALWRAVLLLGV